ncbi:MAG TPA: efflux RND transporter periplasmic adaptor subunit [Candidatus Acidoferrales bacterium]|nr:efflux RND transporter periplasmic adaptor subunit [Candidatus Acidoferrales bacterium]
MNKLDQSEIVDSNQRFTMDRKIEKKPFYKRRLSWIYAGGGALFLFLIILIISDTGAKLNVEADKITVSTVAEGDFQEFIPVTGNVLPRTTFYLDAILGGIVEKKFVEEGVMLKEGDRILQLSNTNVQLSTLQQETFAYQQINDARNTRLQIEQNSNGLQNALVSANYAVINAKEIFDRQSKLKEKNLISQQDYELAENNYHLAAEQQKLAYQNFFADSIQRQSQLTQIASSIERLQKNLELIRENIENLTVRAPINGQLTSLNAETGQSKNPGDQIGQIDALDGFKVRADIDEFYIARVMKGLHASVDIDEKTFTLSVTKVYSEVTGGKFQVDMEFDGKVPDGIRRGQTLQIRLQLSERTKALLLPRGGFYQKTGGQWVFVLNKSGNTAAKKSISLGRQNPDYFEVLSGLNPGDKVVTSSYDNFGDVQELILR